MINKLVGSTGIGIVGGGGTGSLYIDKDDDNYGIGENLTFHTDAEDNIAIGENALNSTSAYADEVATGNIGIGTSALTALTVGDSNVAIGRHAMKVNTLGNRNTTLGFGTMEATNATTTDTTQSSAIAIASPQVITMDGANANIVVGMGVSAATGVIPLGTKVSVVASSSANPQVFTIDRQLTGELASSTLLTFSGALASDDNVFIGFNCGNGTWTYNESSDNVAIGSYAMDDALNGQNGTVAIGKSALGALTSGADNIAIGYQAGLLNTTGASNTYIGYAVADATHVDSTGNVAIGKNAFGGSHTTTASSSNTAVGEGAMGTGALNGVIGATALGYSALAALTTGEGNTAIGYTALVGEDDGDYNTAVGWGALTTQAGTSGEVGNTAVGYYAGLNVTTGTQNTFIGTATAGEHAGNAITGSGNSCLGYHAGYQLEGATNSNTLVGSAAGSALTTGAGNTAVGYQAAVATTGAGNTCIGHQAGDAIVTGTNNICIGFTSDVSDESAINRTALGYGVTNGLNNSVVLGDNDVTDVYMAQDSGAAIHCGTVISTPDAITATSSGVAASLLTLNTEVTTNGDSDLDNVTLANGTSGQIKNIYCVAEGNSSDTFKITPATMCGGTQITFGADNVGLGCTMVYADNEGWVVTGNNGGTIS